MTAQTNAATTANPAKIALNKELETAAWGLFFIMLGAFILIPDEIVSKGWESVGIGVILLGLNAVRYFNGIRMSGFTTFIGLLALAGGIAQLLGWNSLDGAFFLIILGAYLILKPWFDRRQILGKAEQA